MEKDKDFKKFISELTPSEDYCFIHKTSSEYLTQILESGYLLSCKETGNENYTCNEEKNFIFLSLVRPSDKIKFDIVSESEPILVFDSRLYLDYGMKNKCHFSIGWQYGEFIPGISTKFNKFAEPLDLNQPEYTDDEKLKLNLNYIDSILGIEDDKIEEVPFTSRTPNELVISVSEKSNISLKYLKFILFSPYLKVERMPKWFYNYKNLYDKKVLKKYEDFNFNIIDDFNGMEQNDVKKYINIESWKNLGLYKKLLINMKKILIR